MRSAQLLYSLYTATAALAAPVLLRPASSTRSHDQAVTDPSSSRPIGYKPPITVTIEGSRTVVLGPDYHRLALEEEGEDSDGSAQVTIDNRPLVPSSSQNAQQPTLAVLSSARPLTTDHLQALSRLQSEQAQPQQEAARPEPSRQLEMPVGSLVAPGSSPADGARHVHDAVVQEGHSSSAAGPQHGGPRVSWHEDAVNIKLISIYVLIIVLALMWKLWSRKVQQFLGREGAIFLKEDKKTAGRRTSSFRDPDLEIPETTKEQGGEQGGDSDEVENYGAEPWVL